MTTLETLPTELALQCADYLARDDLGQLALVSRRLCLVAQGNLHCAPQLGGLYRSLHYKATIYRQGSFDHTLLRRPDLARKIRTLNMVTSAKEQSTCIEPYEDATYPEEYDEASGDILRIALQSVQWSARVESWNVRLKKGNGHAWAGLILALSPQLGSLEIEVLGRLELSDLDSWDDRKYGRNPLQKLFGYISEDATPEGILPTDLSTVPGLRGLRHLRLICQELDTS